MSLAFAVVLAGGCGMDDSETGGTSCREVLSTLDASSKVASYQSDLVKSCSDYAEFETAFAAGDYPFASGVLLVFCGLNLADETPANLYESALCRGARANEPLLRPAAAQPSPKPSSALGTPLKSYINFENLGVFFNRIHRTAGDPTSISGTLSVNDGMPLINCRMTATLRTPAGVVELSTVPWRDDLFAVTPGEVTEIVLEQGASLQDQVSQVSLDGSDFWGIEYELSCDPGGE